MNRKWQCRDAIAVEALGASVALRVFPPAIIYIEGNLGGGKTTWARGFVQALDASRAVKSPTYTLVEPYELNQLTIYHMDLYRLNDPEELDFLGFRDWLIATSILLIEWPERAVERLPKADILVTFRVIPEGREIGMSSVSVRGTEMLNTL